MGEARWSGQEFDAVFTTGTVGEQNEFIGLFVE
jgi:hypothetical protein